MKTFRDCILEIIDEKNVDNEYIEEDILIKGIDEYNQAIGIDKNLEKFKDRENVYNKLLELKVKHFRTYTFEMLVFYFMNYSIITELIMMKGHICFQLDHDQEISKQERTELYHKALSLVGQCYKLEFSYQTIDVHLRDIKRLLEIAD